MFSLALILLFLPLACSDPDKQANVPSSEQPAADEPKGRASSGQNVTEATTDGDGTAPSPRITATPTRQRAFPTSTPLPTDVAPVTLLPLETDREVLVALFNATDGPNWNSNTNWLDDVTISQWSGAIIATGRGALLLQPPAIQPSQAAIRRAISTGYYAAFHALTASNADVRASTGTGRLPTKAWMRVYRGLNHGYARAQLLQNRSFFSTNGRISAHIFRQLQDERLQADYNPGVSFTPESARIWLDKVAAAASDLLQTTQEERAAMAVLTLVRPR